jgi:hypothetical protein
MPRQPSIAANWTARPVYHGDTWDGFTWAATSDGTAFAGTLTSVELVFADNDNVAGLTLTQASGITIDVATANAWAITVNQINALSLAVGTWSMWLTTTDDSSIRKTRCIGSLTVKDKP